MPKSKIRRARGPGESRQMATVFIPFAMRKIAEGASSVDVPGGNLREVIDNLEALYPGMKERIVENDSLKPGLAAVVGEQPTREGLRAKVEADAEVHFLPHIAGG